MESFVKNVSHFVKIYAPICVKSVLIVEENATATGTGRTMASVEAVGWCGRRYTFAEQRSMKSIIKKIAMAQEQ
jgi:hypothetical protein